jgi:hypothetical protein
MKVRELQAEEVVSVAHINTKDNPADIFTKPVDRVDFLRHRSALMSGAAVI